MTEQWKDVVGYEGLYEISNMGRCRNIKFNRPLKENQSFKYPRFVLSKDGISKSICVHRIVAKAFIPNPDNFETVNHIDENHLHNYIENLEWCSARDNTRKHFYPGLSENELGLVAQYDFKGTLINTFKTLEQASKQFNKKHNLICMCCNGIRKTAYGFKWGYI